jgi:starvation-inducible DNA-binding protein
MDDLLESFPSESLALLQARLADALDLAARLKQAYWRSQDRTLVEVCHDEIDDCINALTRRIGSLSGVAESCIRAAALDSLPDQYPLVERHPGQHERSSRIAMKRFAKALRSDVDRAIRLGDRTTADVLCEISRKVAELIYRWVLSSRRRRHDAHSFHHMLQVKQPSDWYRTYRGF